MSSARVAVITGGAQGIGRAIALRLAGDGLDVVINDLPSKKCRLDEVVREIQVKGRRAIAVAGDVSSQVDVQNLIDVTVRELGGLDVFVANAGFLILSPFMETTVRDWDALFAVNARGVFLCYQAAAAQLIKQGRGGRIIGACSTAGKRGAKDYSAYCATKFAVRGLTQSVAQELGMYGITVNAYAPGVVDTDLVLGLDEAHRTREGLAEGSRSQDAAERTPYGKMGAPEDIAGLVSYIASPESNFVTGQCLNINGGSHFD